MSSLKEPWQSAKQLSACWKTMVLSRLSPSPADLPERIGLHKAFFRVGTNTGLHLMPGSINRVLTIIFNFSFVISSHEQTITQTKYCTEVVFSMESDRPLLCILTPSADNGETMSISRYHPVPTPFGVFTKPEIASKC